MLTDAFHAIGKQLDSILDGTGKSLSRRNIIIKGQYKDLYEQYAQIISMFESQFEGTEDGEEPKIYEALNIMTQKLNALSGS